MRTQIRKMGLIALFMAMLALPCLSAAADKDKHSAKFGDLHLTVTKMEDMQSAPHKGDHHHVAVFVKVENTGKGVICASFFVTLITSFDLQYHPGMASRPSQPPPPRMREMLPGESTEGSYDFYVKDGVEPRELVLKLWGPPRTIRCGRKETDALPAEVRLDVHDLPAPEPPSPQDSTP